MTERLDGPPCEYCEWDGKKVAALHVVGTDYTPVCKKHFEWYVALPEENRT